MAAIELNNVGKLFRTTWRRQQIVALTNVSLSVEQGEAFGFIGQNGAGKSTTIKILTGALRPDSGKAQLFGINVEDYRSRRGVGYVPENPWLYDYLTPLEIVRMGVAHHGNRQGPDADRHCKQWLERFGIGASMHRRISGFSKGMLQRTALAHALACEPKLLILDEPLSGLDPLGRMEVVDILMNFRQQGGTIFFSSHVLHDVERLADRFGLIHKGCICSIQDHSDLLTQSQTVNIRSLGDVSVEGFSPDVGRRWFAEVPLDQVWSALDRLREANHQVLEIKPAMVLERVFLNMVGHSPNKE